MTLPRSAADVLAGHVVFEIESIDRMYLNVWQPRLQHGAGAAAFFTSHRGHAYASTALMDPMTKAFVADIHHFINARGLDLVHFGKERKDEVTQRYLADFTGTDGVLYAGRAQEKATVWRTQRRYHADGSSYAWLVKTSALVNFFYFYCVDADFGPFFIKFCTYFPYTAKLCINGHEWAKRQAAQAGIGFEALDNGFAAGDAAALQAICDRLGPPDIDALLDKWLRILPHPFTADDIAAGYTYELSILQAEFSLTQVLDAPVAGRIFFEQVIRDNLDIGRPDQVALVFARRIIRKGRFATPGRFRTRVITSGVVPSLHIDYKHTKIKQYHKLGRALRTETTINDAPADFGIPKRLTSLPALRQIGFAANRRLLGVQTISHDPIRGASAFTSLTAPIITPAGTRIPGLRFGDPRVHALLQALLIHRLLPRGFTNRELRTLIAPLLGQAPEDITAGKMTYDLRRLREHGLIARIPRTRRYQVTDTGLHDALLFTHAHDHLLRPGLAQTADPSPPAPSPLRAAAHAYQAAYDDLARQAHLAA
jgi:hypothetical protein